jgi:hypothetical protein
VSRMGVMSEHRSTENRAQTATRTAFETAS